MQVLARSLVATFSLFCALNAPISRADEVQVLAPPVAPTIVAPTPIDPDFAPIPTPEKLPVLEPRPWNWQPMTIENLPASVKVFAGDMVNAENQIVRGWYVDIDYSDPTLQAQTALSTVPLGREATSSLAQKMGAIVAVNGGYFDMKSVPSKTYSTVIKDGQLLAKNVETASRSIGKVPLTRGAFGILPDRSFQIRWVAHFGNETRAYDAPIANTYRKAAPAATAENGTIWDVTQAIGGAPVLIHSGKINITGEAEAIGPEMTEKRHPRTAIGWSGGNRLILFVCDGRQPNWSMGQTLPETAQTLFDLGCVEALNLDGGGSTALVVNNTLLNKPSDGRERNVTSIFGIVQRPEAPQ